MKQILPLVPTLILALAGPARADMADQLKRGEIVTVSVPNGAQPWAGRAMGLVEAPPALVEQILSGIGEYQRFVPRVVSSRKLKDNRFVVELDLPWPLGKVWAYVRVQSGQRDGTLVIRWNMLNGTFKKYEGVAWVQPWGPGRSMLIYQTLAVPNTAAPDAWITGGLREAAQTVVESVRKRAAQLSTARVAAGASKLN